MSEPMLQELNDVAHAPERDSDESSSGTPWVSSVPVEAVSLARRHEVLTAFVLSVAAHLVFARTFADARQGPLPPVPRASRVEVQFSRPPPPPPPPTPPHEPPPPPPKPMAMKAKPVAQAPAPAAPPPLVALEAREDIGIDAPLGDEGELPKGTGEIGTAPPPLPPAPVELAPAKPPAVLAAREGANYAKNPRPPYPQLAVRKGWEGVSTLRVQVLPNGHPGTITVQTSSGRDVLDDAAIEAVKGWTFVPATQGGQAISGWVNVPIVFRLQ